MIAPSKVTQPSTIQTAWHFAQATTTALVDIQGFRRAFDLDSHTIHTSDDTITVAMPNQSAFCQISSNKHSSVKTDDCQKTHHDLPTMAMGGWRSKSDGDWYQ